MSPKVHRPKIFPSLLSSLSPYSFSPLKERYSHALITPRQLFYYFKIRACACGISTPLLPLIDFMYLPILLSSTPTPQRFILSSMWSSRNNWCRDFVLSTIDTNLEPYLPRWHYVFPISSTRLLGLHNPTISIVPAKYRNLVFMPSEITRGLTTTSLSRAIGVIFPSEVTFRLIVCLPFPWRPTLARSPPTRSTTRENQSL